MWRNIASNGVTFLVIALFLLAGVILWGQNQYISPGPLSQAICVEVKPGARMGQISEQLDEKGAVTSPAIFRIGADYTDKSGALKAGSYLVEPGASMQQIVDVITRGGASTCGTEIIYRVGINAAQALVRQLDPATSRFQELAKFDLGAAEIPAAYLDVAKASDTRFRVALAEGVTSWQVTEALKGIDILDGAVPDVPAEGTLAPDSYEVTKGESRTALLGRMAERQSAILAELWAERADDLPLKSPEEALILASIVEKETGVPEERRQVASVFVNRLERGMRLQTDPTVIYGITKGQGVLGRGLRRSELRRETPWNTYVIDALPPTPIANPGRLSIEAALNPDTTEYVYFVADGTGGHAFAKTLDEHNANVARWRKIEAERGGN